MIYQLPKLNYNFDSLEPFIDKQTMELHYTKHHQAYIDKLNGVLEKYPKISETPLEEIMLGFSKIEMDEKDKLILKNNGGGHLNHALYWQIMGNRKKIDKELSGAVKEYFGSLDEFYEVFTNTALSHFGSGWAWLTRDKDGDLSVLSLPNQDSPYLIGHTPIIGLDLWEHAYYLKYQNRRADYVKNWWNVLKLL